MPEQNTENTIFIGNVPYDATEEEVRSICESVGQVLKIKLIKDNGTVYNKGIAFCEYYNSDVARNAITKLKHKTIRGRELRFDTADGKRNAPSVEVSALARFSDQDVYRFVCDCQEYSRSHPNEMREILSNNDSMVRGLLEAFQEMDMLKEKVQGMDLHSRF